MTVPNTVTYTDSTGQKGNARYTYKVCEADTQNCSNEVTVRFGGPSSAGIPAPATVLARREAIRGIN